MSTQVFELIHPALALRASYLTGVGELQNEGWLHYADYDLAEIAADFGRHLRAIDAARTERHGDIVPETELWGVVEGVWAGRLAIRHELTEALHEYGGHIGYDVVPRFRGRGVATRMLAASLPIARALGIKRALITCDADNNASVRVIEKNGGVLGETRGLMGGRVPHCYYWIDLN